MCKIFVRVIPNASRTEVVSFCNDILKVKVMAPADSGRANEALVNFLVKQLKIKTISIASGLRSRNKILDFGEKFSSEEIVNMLVEK
ncbi:MAG: DUF167 domain-containing protein [Puniceicoccales bacterium]|jgi:uncharacterized protein (TIGR00251 family)|nr:DUF167 domain-containing protein [Puniceicoccales bacterium]